MAIDGDVIARRGDHTFLVVAAGKGVIVDMEERVVFPPLCVRSVLSRGYWEPVSEGDDVASVLKLFEEKINEQPPVSR